MLVVPHVYYRIVFPDFMLPDNQKKMTGQSNEFRDIPAATGSYECYYRDNKDYLISGEYGGQKTIEELIKSVSRCCKLGELPTYNIRMSRNVLCFLSGEGGIFDVLKSAICIDYTDKDNVFDFIYCTTDTLIYKSNIREVLKSDFKRINLRIPNVFYRDSILYDQESKIDPNIPLFVRRYDDDEVIVEKIRENKIVVNRDLLQLQPQATGQCPDKLLELLKRTREEITMTQVYMTR